MNKLFENANQYMKESDWRDLALLKFCLCAVGVMIGIAVPKEKRKVPLIMAALVFVATYIPLMTKFIKIVMRNQEEG